MQVLIIDDVPEIVELVRLILEDQGIVCISSSNAADGMDIARNGSVDLILLDILMPGEDGFALCRKLKSDEATKEIPVIFITGKGDDESIVKGFELGAIDYIPKPFNRYELLSRVQTHLKLVSRTRELNSIISVKDRVLSIIAHELRNQFSSLMNMYELFSADLEGMENPQLQRHLHSLSYGLSETHDLFDNLITWSRNQRGKFRMKYAKIHLYSVIQEIENGILNGLEYKELTLDNRVDPALFAVSDETLVRLIIRNFVTNAIKFSYRGGTITVSSMTEQGCACLTVQDEGMGIDPEVKNDLFHIDKNPTTAGTEKEKGTGIGLIICRDFAKKIGASIDVESEPGEGAAFTLHIPVYPSPGEDPS